MRSPIAPMFILLATIIFGCGAPLTGTDGGGSSSTTNTFALQISTNAISGKTHPGNRVAVYAAEYQTGYPGTFADSQIVQTDSGFSFSNLQPGFYRVLAWDSTRHKGIHVGIIPVPPQPGTVSSLVDSLRVVSEITGAVAFENLSQGIPRIATVCILGTPFGDVTDSTGVFRLKNVPPGSYIVQAALGTSAVQKIFPMTTSGASNCAFVKVSPDSAASPVSLTVSP
jgi:hypothetical protein